MSMCPLGKTSAFMKPWKCQRRSLRNFTGCAQALAFPKGYNGSYICLGRDISYNYRIA